jgi:hypothetical protein
VLAGGTESADFIHIRISVPPALSAANGIQFALEALLPYSLSWPAFVLRNRESASLADALMNTAGREEAYEDRTNLVS